MLGVYLDKFWYAWKVGVCLVILGVSWGILWCLRVFWGIYVIVGIFWFYRNSLGCVGVCFGMFWYFLVSWVFWGVFGIFGNVEYVWVCRGIRILSVFGNIGVFCGILW